MMLHESDSEHKLRVRSLKHRRQSFSNQVVRVCDKVRDLAVVVCRAAVLLTGSGEAHRKVGCVSSAQTWCQARNVGGNSDVSWRRDDSEMKLDKMRKIKYVERSDATVGVVQQLCTVHGLAVRSLHHQGLARPLAVMKCGRGNCASPTSSSNPSTASCYKFVLHPSPYVVGFMHMAAHMRPNVLLATQQQSYTSFLRRLCPSLQFCLFAFMDSDLWACSRSLFPAKAATLLRPSN
jgi:hypothetical protein